MRDTERFNLAVRRRRVAKYLLLRNWFSRSAENYIAEKEKIACKCILDSEFLQRMNLCNAEVISSYPLYLINIVIRFTVFRPSLPAKGQLCTRTGSQNVSKYNFNFSAYGCDANSHGTQLRSVIWCKLMIKINQSSELISKISVLASLQLCLADLRAIAKTFSSNPWPTLNLSKYLPVYSKKGKLYLMGQMSTLVISNLDLSYVSDIDFT